MQPMRSIVFIRGTREGCWPAKAVAAGADG